MADGQIKIRIGGSVDRSLDVAFGNVEKRAMKARDNIAKMFGASSAGRGMQQIATGAEKAYAGVEKAAMKAGRAQATAQERSARDQVKSQERAAREIERIHRQQVRAAEALDRQRSAGLMREFRAQEREALRSSRAVERFASRTSHRATHFLFPPPTGMLGGAKRIAGDIMRGAGVDMSISGSVGRAVSLQSEAVGLANQERIATGNTRGAAHFEKLARSTGDQFSKSPEQIVSMMRAFTGKTGDFNAAEKLTPQLTSIASASGANLIEMGDAAGFVFSQLKRLPDAADRTIAVMRGIVGQTAVGAVEMKDYATQLGRVAAGAQKFEGDIGENILKFSAMTQLNIESGGATSAADAARGTAAFVNTLGKGARINAFRKAGVQVFSDKEETTHRDPFEIIKDSFRATGGNIPQLSTMFMDVLGRKTITGLTGAFKDAGGGEAGIAAVEKSLDRYMKAQLDAATETKNNADIQASAAAKAVRFQNELDKIVSVTANDVMPAFQRLAPVALKAADAFGGLVQFTAENPGAAITAAIVASIARAGLESAARAGIERAFTGFAGGGVGGGRTAALGGALGLTIATAIIGKALIDSWVAEDQDKQRKDVAQGATDINMLTGAAADARDGSIAGDKIAPLEDLQRRTKARIEAAQRYKKDNEGTSEFVKDTMDAFSPETRKAHQDANHLASLQAEMQRTSALLDMIKSGTLRVVVTNLADMNTQPPKVDPASRSPAPGR